MLFIHKDNISLTNRVLLTVYCPMNLRNFPFDEQTCKMDIRFCKYMFSFHRLTQPLCRLKKTWSNLLPDFCGITVTMCHKTAWVSLLTRDYNRTKGKVYDFDMSVELDVTF